MNAEDLQNVYDELRGSRSAPLVMDARSLFQDQQYTASLAKLTEAREKYQESRFRILKQEPEKQVDAKAKDADRQIRRLTRKRDKAIEILAMIEELVPQLEKLSAKEKKQEAAKESSKPAPKPIEPADRKPSTEDPSSVDSDSDYDSSDESDSEELITLNREAVDDDFLTRFSDANADDQLNLVSEKYGFYPVESAGDVRSDCVYFLRTDEGGLLAATGAVSAQEPVELTNLGSGGVYQVPLSVLAEYGRERKLVLLLQKDGESRSRSEDEGATDEIRDRVLDMGALSQLMESAQRCGIVPGADQIAYVRDKEFRLGQYELALQIIESLNGKFIANMASRSQRLMREEADIASGRTKISPKELQAKRTRDRAQDQAIDRARSRFNRVLDGLRVLLKVDA